MNFAQLLDQAILEGDAEKVERLVKKALYTGLLPGDILHSGLVAAIQNMGERYHNGEVFVPEVIMAVRAMEAGFEVLKKKVIQKNHSDGYQVVIGSVAGDCHDIGKNLVGMMMQATGLAVLDLGADVPPEEFVSALKKYRPWVLALSSVLTITMSGMEETVNAVDVAGLRNNVKIIVGGSPISYRFAQRIGADAYGEDAFIGAQIAKKYTV